MSTIYKIIFFFIVFIVMRFIITESQLRLILSEEFSQEVADVQKELVSKGYDLGSYGPNQDGVDGVLGTKTKEAYEKEYGKPFEPKSQESTDTATEKKSDIQMDTLPVGDYGKLVMSSNKTAPLLVVFGGIPVGGRQSGVYMWDYLGGLKEKYHIFVAKSHNVNGPAAYNSVLKTLSENGVSPSSQVLYLFSGGYRPGMGVLNESAGNFSAVLLVDIWMKGSSLGEYYKNFTKSNSTKVRYYYTSFGANNNDARDFIAKNAGVSEQQSGGGMDAHMKTNNLAVSSL